MRSLLFLIIRSLKNTVWEVLHKPAKLILWLVTIAGIAGIFILSLFTTQSRDAYMDLIWLKGIFFLFILLFLIISIQKGLSNGDIIFDMNDVNLLFVSPVNPRKILVYGIIRMAKMSLTAGFFILFQSNSIRMSFGTGFDAVLLIMLGFVLAVSLMQIISLLIYSLTNSRPRRKMAVRILSAVFFIPLVSFLGIQLLKYGELMPALDNTLRSPVISWTPVVGWASEGVVSLISGNIGRGLLFFGLMILAGALLILYITFSNPDYYEDVLVATETTFQKKRSLAEGQISMEASSSRKVKVIKTGIGGYGINSIFYKHLRESFRANRLGLWGISSILLVLGSAAFALFFRRMGSEGGIMTLLQSLMWAQIFLIGTGRGLKELYSHYIYLIPESSLRKIVWSNLEIVLKVFAESIFIFGIAGILLGEAVPIILISIVTYSMFSFLLLGVNYLSMRFTGADISAGLIIFIYMIAIIIIMLPGIFAAIIIGSLAGAGGLLIGLCILALWELIAALVCFALSQGILHHCDIPVIKTGK